MATAVLAKRQDMTVFSTTRSAEKTAALGVLGVDHVLIDDGDVAAQVRAIVADGVDTALELVGTPTLPDTLRATRVHGVVCFIGMLSNKWTVKDFYPIAYLPRGVRLTAYSGEAADLPAGALQDFLDAVAAGAPLSRSTASTSSTRSSKRTRRWSPAAREESSSSPPDAYPAVPDAPDPCWSKPCDDPCNKLGKT
jgi:NADPH2:quinone reductase